MRASSERINYIETIFHRALSDHEGRCYDIPLNMECRICKKDADGHTNRQFAKCTKLAIIRKKKNRISNKKQQLKHN